MKTDLEEDITLTHIPDKMTVMSGYSLSDAELKKIVELFPEVKKNAIVNVVDKNIISGLIIKVGSRMIDMTLNGALHKLKKQMYESN